MYLNPEFFIQMNQATIILIHSNDWIDTEELRILDRLAIHDLVDNGHINLRKVRGKRWFARARFDSRAKVVNVIILEEARESHKCQDWILIGCEFGISDDGTRLRLVHTTTNLLI